MNSTHFHQPSHSFPFNDHNEPSSRETLETTIIESSLPLDMREFWNIIDEDYFSIPSKQTFDRVNHFISRSKGNHYKYINIYRNRYINFQSQAFTL